MPDPKIRVIIDAYTRGLQDGMDSASDAVGRSTQSMEANLADLGLALDTTQRLFSDVSNIIGRLREEGAKGAEFLSLQKRFVGVAGGADEAARLISQLQEATQGTSSEAELMSSALDLVSRGLVDNKNELVEVTKLVPTLGRQFGNLSADRSMMFFSRMVTNGAQSIRQLSDSFGLSAEAILARSEDLVAAGENQRDAFQQAITEEMLAKYEQLGLQQVTAAEKVAQTNAAVDDQRNALRLNLVPFTEMVNTGIKAVANWERWPGLLKAIQKPLFMLIGYYRGLIVAVKMWVAATVEGAKAVKSALSGNLREAAEQAEIAFRIATEGASEGFVQGLDSAMQEWEQIGQAVEEGVGEDAFQSTEEGADSASDSVGELSTHLEELSGIQEKFADKTASIWDRYSEKVAKASRKAADSLRDAQIDAQRDLEDLERKAMDKRRSIEQDYNAARQQAASQLRSSLVNIERNYQKRRRDILREFARSEEEAIEDRDAVALVKARQRKEEQLQEAKEERDEQKTAAQRRYAEELRIAEKNRRRDLQELQRWRARREQEIARGLRREQQDIQRNLDRRKREFRTWRSSELTETQQYLNSKLAEYQAGNAAIEAEQARHITRMRALGAVAGNAGSGNPFTGPYEMAEGGSGVVRKPTLFLAGEAGPERFAFQPLGSSSQRGGTATSNNNIRVVQNFTFSGSFSSQEREWFQREARKQAREAIGEAFQ